MTEIKNCPSTLLKGFDAYSPKALKTLFGGTKVNHILNFDIDEFRNVGEIADAMHRISVSGVQEKFPVIIKKTLRDRKLIPTNEPLTMHIASQVYGIQTAANGLCLTPKGQPMYLTRRFDILPDSSKLH